LRSCSSTRLRRRGSRDSVRSKKTGAKRTATGSLRFCQSKSPSTLSTHAPNWPLTPMVPPTRPPLTLKFPVELRPDGLSGSLSHSLWPNA
jgi:hypothetical protein